MTEEFRYPLGEHRGRSYYLNVRVRPSFDDVEGFAVTVFYRDRTGDRTVEVARIDTSHGYPHFDRLYHRSRPKEPIDVTVWEAIGRLENHWRRYAREYDRNHDK